MFRLSGPVSYRRLIPESPAKCYICVSTYHRAMQEIDPDWALNVHPLFDREIAEAICFVWETIEGYLQVQHNFTGTIQALTINGNGTIGVEMVQQEQLDAVTLDIIDGQKSFIASIQSSLHGKARAT